MTSRGAYYNEIEPFAADWLRNLIAAGHIAAGDVDTRSIVDVQPDDLRGYAQAHFFAGVGVWSYALRLAGVPDDARVWTGSCPCQPFSAAGRGDGFADERHLWPAFHRLIAERRPPVVFGEQVASRDADLWLDLVQDDLEALGYAVGAVPFPAASQTVDFAESRIGAATLEWIRGALGDCPDPELALLLRDFAAQDRGSFGVGAPNLRDRLYWVADAAEPGWHEQPKRDDRAHWRQAEEPGRLRAVGRLADTAGERWERGDLDGASGAAACDRAEEGGRRPAGLLEPAGFRTSSLMADTAVYRKGAGQQSARPSHDGRRSVDRGRGADGGLGLASSSRPQGISDGRGDVFGPGGTAAERAGGEPARRLERGSGAGSVHGGWEDSDWLFCRDGRARPVEPRTFPLAHGIAGRVGRLRAFGNAINPRQAARFVAAFMEVRP